MSNLPSRRETLGLILASGAATLLPAGSALALDKAGAERLVGRVIGEINEVINSGRSESAMLADFEKIFTKYADIPIIGRSALGVAARQASSAQLNAFTLAFRGYISRKYGRRFREFIGGRIEVTSAKPVKSFIEVTSTAFLSGEAPFELRWQVSDKSGRDLFFNLIIEGVNLLATERTEIGAMLDKRKGSIDKLIADLKTAG